MNLTRGKKYHTDAAVLRLKTSQSKCNFCSTFFTLFLSLWFNERALRDVIKGKQQHFKEVVKTGLKKRKETAKIQEAPIASKSNQIFIYKNRPGKRKQNGPQGTDGGRQHLLCIHFITQTDHEVPRDCRPRVAPRFEMAPSPALFTVGRPLQHRISGGAFVRLTSHGCVSTVCVWPSGKTSHYHQLKKLGGRSERHEGHFLVRIMYTGKVAVHRCGSYC